MERSRLSPRSPRPVPCPGTAGVGRRRPPHSGIPASTSCAPTTGGGSAVGTPTATPRAATAPSPPIWRRLVEAFCQLAAATGEARWIEEAQAVADTLLDRYWDVGEGGLFTVPDDGPADGTPLIARQKDLLDNATPSANSTAAGGLYRLAALTGELRYANQADRILQLVGPLAAKAPTAFGYALAAIDMRRTGITEIVVPGGEPEFLAVARETWRPNSVLAWGEPFPSPLWHDRQPGLAYVCQNAACQLPSATPENSVSNSDDI